VKRLALVTLLLVAGALGALRVTRPAAPDLDTVRRTMRPSDQRLLDRHGELLYERRTDPSRRRLDWVSLADVSPALRTAVVAAEDHRFAEHHGVDVRAIVAAAIDTLRGRGPRGASTITMQVASLVEPSLRRRGGARTLRQKWRQMRLARAIERRWTKDEILETYLNLATFRGELDGVGAAAAVLFGKAPHGLDAAEALTLAVLLQAPNASSAVVERRARALRDVTGLAADDAVLAQTLRRPPASLPTVTLAPHVARRLLPAHTRTTLDAGVQRLATGALRRNLLGVRDLGVRDGAVLVVDNASGDVLAWVGSSGPLSATPHVDGVTAPRQAGSSLKPFLYALALEQRLVTPASLVLDAPLEIATPAGLYRPRNYDDHFRGLTSVRTALASSLNTPAVRTLELVGVEAFVQRLRTMGLTSVDQDGDFYGPSLALGSADVTLRELVNGYRTLARGGAWTPLRLVPDDVPPPPRQVVSAAAAFQVGDILADRESRSVTFGLENVLGTRMWTAVKTGTSKDMRDNWCIGWSQRFTVGVWVGNFSGAPMHEVSGITGAAPIWAEIMTALHRGLPSEAPSPPRGLTARAVRFAGDVEGERTDWFQDGTGVDAVRPLAIALPRIRTPASGTRIALDPDIPPDHQRLLVATDAPRADLRFVIDGRPLGSAGASRLWEPTQGAHTLTLVDAGDRELDRVTLDVRGRVAR
jgi:penicillin-binding protein 1C